MENKAKQCILWHNADLSSFIFDCARKSSFFGGVSRKMPRRTNASEDKQCLGRQMPVLAFVLWGICPLRHLSFETFVLRGICPSWHLSVEAFVLRGICPSRLLSFEAFVRRGICPPGICPSRHLSSWHLSFETYRDPLGHSAYCMLRNQKKNESWRQSWPLLSSLHYHRHGYSNRESSRD